MEPSSLEAPKRSNDQLLESLSDDSQSFPKGRQVSEHVHFCIYLHLSSLIVTSCPSMLKTYW